MTTDLEELRKLAEKAIAVKPLEWRQMTSPREDGPPDLLAEWEADCILGTYIIKDDGDEWWLHLADLFDTHQIGRSSDLDLLRDVAARDYSARILSAIDLSPILALVSELEALREAVKPFAEAAESIDDNEGDRIEMWEHPASMQVTAADFRRARAALTKNGS